MRAEDCAALSAPMMVQRSRSMLSSGPASTPRARLPPAANGSGNQRSPRRASPAKMGIDERPAGRLGVPVAPVDVESAGEAEPAVGHQDLAVVAQVGRV